MFSLYLNNLRLLYFYTNIYSYSIKSKPSIKDDQLRPKLLHPIISHHDLINHHDQLIGHICNSSCETS